MGERPEVTQTGFLGPGRHCASSFRNGTTVLIVLIVFLATASLLSDIVLYGTHGLLVDAGAALGGVLYGAAPATLWREGWRARLVGFALILAAANAVYILWNIFGLGQAGLVVGTFALLCAGLASLRLAPALRRHVTVRC